MSNTVRINLQPPPNVDFVTGYPGIPPGPDRPQASVKGAIEVRVQTQGVKAKWVRIELRKVETLPEGGPANTFYDFVGPSPVNLWSTSDEYSLLRTQDFPFSIRIPESLPPTVSLHGKAGVGYELVASVCTKGKRGFLRKAKSVVTSTVAPITIDKHELHTTWPVYCQPETRRLAQDGVVLTAERSHTCYGPGDRIALVATIKSESLSTLILRGFEFYLQERIVYRAGTGLGGNNAGGGGGGGSGKNAVQTKEVVLCETKVPVNATLYGGTSHSQELSLMMSPQHTTTTLNAARHIDVTYTLCLRALMGTGATLAMDLPVMISNWQRSVSFDAIKRIGHAPGLSLLHSQQQHQHIAPVLTSHIERVSPPTGVGASATLPNNLYGHARSNSGTDELGYGVGGGGGGGGGISGGRSTITGITGITGTTATTATTTASNGLLRDDSSSIKPSLSAQTSYTANTSTTANIYAGNSYAAAGGSGAGGSGSGSGSRAGAGAGGSGAGAGAGGSGIGGSGSGSGSGAAGPAKKWLTAEEEKIMLYEQARSNVAKIQGEAAAPPPASVIPVMTSVAATSSPSRGPSASASVTKTTTTAPTAAPAAAQKTWLSAEEEKRRFREAQEAVQRAQGVAPQSFGASSPASSHARNNSDPKVSGGSGSGSGAGGGSSKPSGADLYAQAIRAQNQRAAGSGSGSGSGSGAGGSSARSQPAVTTPPVPAYMTAEQEKAALRRYEEAKRAVEQTQNGVGADEPVPSNPIAYEDLFPKAGGAGSSSSNPPPPAGDSLPPAFEVAAGPSNIMNQLSEKERLRRAYEAQDAAAAARQTTNRSPAPPAAYSPPAPAPAPAPTPAHSLPGPYANALEEKEALRRKFEARDAARAASQPTPTPQTPPPPVRSATGGASTTTQDSPARSPGANSTSSFRPTPLPPAASASPQRVLTAAEEKALLRAKFEARDNAAAAGRKPGPPGHAINGNGNGNGPATPPIAHNASAMTMNGPPPPPPLMPRPPVEYIKETQEEDARVSRLNGPMPNLDTDLSLDLKPFTPFKARFDSSPVTPPGPPPSLP